MFFYGIMTGMSLSACRAIGMYLIRMLAVIVGRSYDMLTAMGILAVLMVWQNPFCLLNAGYLLSFGSILGIGWFYPALQPEQKKWMPKRYESIKWKMVLCKLFYDMKNRLVQSIVAGGSITIFTLPIQLWFYYEVPIYSVWLNLLVLPFMETVMITGLISMLLPGTGILGTITCVILRAYEWLCEGFSQLPFHTWNPGQPQIWQILLYYLLLFVVVALRTVPKSGEKKGYAPTVMVLTVAVIGLTIHIPTKSTITFLDVGQGDGIVVELSTGEVYLFDCGSSTGSRLGQYVLIPYLKCNGIRHIDAVFVSHADIDHCSGIEELLTLGRREGITVGQLVLPNLSETMRHEEFSELLQLIKEMEHKQQIMVSYVGAGDSFTTKSASFLCLHPPKAYETQSSNAYSECFYVELYGKQSVNGQKKRIASLLLTGDVEGEGEELLLQEIKERGINKITILKVAHHGSKYSTSDELLQIIKPDVSIISCGENNSYGHPHIETLERLDNIDSKILTTPVYGAITIEIDEEVKAYGFTK